MEFNFKESINSINQRIKIIEQMELDLKDKKLNEKYFMMSLKLNLIEIGEESKKLNDYLKYKKKSWDEIISKSYNFRISLTHYYKEFDDKNTIKYYKKNFPDFCKKIKQLEKEK